MQQFDAVINLGLFVIALLAMITTLALAFWRSYQRDIDKASKNRRQVWDKLAEMESDMSVVKNNLQHLKEDIEEIKPLVKKN